MKDRLRVRATRLTLEQQQKLCIARLLPLKPRIILMDEPCSALDAEGIERIEQLIDGLCQTYTIVMVTHNMAQARRASHECIFMLMGRIVEHDSTLEMFHTPETSRHGALRPRPLRVIRVVRLRVSDARPTALDGPP